MMVFIDEAGTPVGGNDFYVLAAVMVEDADLEQSLHAITEIRTKHKTGSELKSSSIGGSLNRRKNICIDLGQLNARVAVQAIDKSLVNQESGLQFKASAYKNFQKRIFSKIFQSLSSPTVILDSFGSSDYMESFEKYLSKNESLNLFQRATNLIRSTPKQYELLQVADFIAGTTRRYLVSDDPRDAFSHIAPLIKSLEIWPFPRSNIDIKHSSTPLDLKIEQHCLKKCLEYLTHEDDNILREAMAFLLHSYTLNNNSYIYGDQILDHLKHEGLISKDRDKNWLQQNVVAKLREKTLPIVASRDGYKIPRGRLDLKEFVEFVSQKTLPYLSKVNTLRTELRIALNEDYDMLEDEPQLFNLMKSFGSNR